MAIMINMDYFGEAGRVEKQCTAEEITNLIKEGHFGSIIFESFFGSYEIDGVDYTANSLSIGDDTFVYEQNGKIIIPTYFRRGVLANQQGQDPNEKIMVDAIIDPIKNPIRVMLRKGE